MKNNIQDTLAEIEALAEKAGKDFPGSWEWRPYKANPRTGRELVYPGVYSSNSILIFDGPESVEKLAAATNPEAMKQIIAYIRKLEARVEAADELADAARLAREVEIGEVWEMKLTKEKLDSLYKLAEAATPGYWVFDTYSTVMSPHNDDEYICAFPIRCGDTATPQGKADAEFVESANPEAMKQIIGYIRKLEARVEAADELADAVNIANENSIECLNEKIEIDEGDMITHGGYFCRMLESYAKYRQISEGE